MRNLLIFATVVALFSACERENGNNDRNRSTSAHVCAVDLTNGDTLVGASIYLGKVHQSGGSVIYVDSKVSDSTGFVDFNFHYDENYYYYVYGGMGNLILQQYVIVQIGEQNNLAVNLHHPGFIQLHIKNTNPFDTADVLSLYDSDYYQYEHLFTGNTIDTNLIITQYGNIPGNIKWRVTKNDTTNTYNQSVTSIADDTLFIDLFY